MSVGAQDCHAQPSGAHTGDLSAQMIADCGATYVIVGHSERRADHGETDAMVRAKAQAALAAGLTPIVCVGETEAQRKAGETLAVVGRQLEGSIPDDAPATLVVAYEPIWAIGTGSTPTVGDVAEVHASIRATLASRFGADGMAMRLLYGGSVKASNAGRVDGDRQRRWRAGRRREPEGGGLHGDRRRISARVIRERRHSIAARDRQHMKRWLPEQGSNLRQSD